MTEHKVPEITIDHFLLEHSDKLLDLSNNFGHGGPILMLLSPHALYEVNNFWTPLLTQPRHRRSECQCASVHVKQDVLTGRTADVSIQRPRKLRAHSSPEPTSSDTELQR